MGHHGLRSLALPLLTVLWVGWCAVWLRVLLVQTSHDPAICGVAFACELAALLWLRWALGGFADPHVLGQTAAQQRAWGHPPTPRYDAGAPPIAVRRALIDLDAPPSLRWLAVVRTAVAAGEAARMKRYIVGELVGEYGKLGAVALSLALRVLLTAHVRFCMPPCFREELLSIARLTAPHGLTYFDLMALNYGGDFLAHCTSAVVDHGRSPLHLRNMDWYPQESIRPLTIELDFSRGGAVLYTSTSWVFFVGTHTCMLRRGGPADGCGQRFSVSMNFRYLDNGVAGNVLRLLGPAWPQSFLIRHCVETSPASGSGYEHARARLSRAALIAPCYFVVGGSDPRQGCIIERNAGTGISQIACLGTSQSPAGQPLTVGAAAAPSAVVMTNCDCGANYIPIRRTCDEDPLMLNALLVRCCWRSLSIVLTPPPLTLFAAPPPRCPPSARRRRTGSSSSTSLWRTTAWKRATTPPWPCSPRRR